MLLDRNRSVASFIAMSVQPLSHQVHILPGSVNGATLVGDVVTYRKCGAHADDLDRLLETQQLGSHELQKISSVLIVNHVQLVKHNCSKLGDGAVVNCGVYKRIRLVYC